MPPFSGPPTKNDGEVVFGSDWNAGWNLLADYLNNGGNNAGIGNGQVTTDPSERIAGSKVDPDPGAHGSRHASGGADPLPDGSISGDMLQPALFTDDKLTLRRNAVPALASNLGLAYVARSARAYEHGDATSQPFGRGVVRSGKVYFSLYNADAVTELNPSTGAFIDIALAAGDKPRQLLLVGTDIYVLCGGGGAGGQAIKKIDAANQVTSVCNMRADGPQATADLIDVDEMALHPTGGVIFCIGKRTGDTVYRVLLRVSLSVGTGVSHKVDLGVTNTPQFVGCVTLSNGVSERVAVLYHDTVPTNNIKTYSTADLTPVGTTSLAQAVISASSLVSDGAWAVVGAVGALSRRVQQVEVLTQTNPVVVMTFVGDDDLTAPSFFDGRTIVHAVLGATRPTVAFTTPFGRGSGPARIIDDPGSACVVNGYATDGADLYFAISNGATSNARIMRIPA